MTDKDGSGKGKETRVAVKPFDRLADRIAHEEFTGDLAEDTGKHEALPAEEAVDPKDFQPEVREDMQPADPILIRRDMNILAYSLQSVIPPEETDKFILDSLLRSFVRKLYSIKVPKDITDTEKIKEFQAAAVKDKIKMHEYFFGELLGLGKDIVGHGILTTRDIFDNLSISVNNGFKYLLSAEERANIDNMIRDLKTGEWKQKSKQSGPDSSNPNSYSNARNLLQYLGIKPEGTRIEGVVNQLERARDSKLEGLTCLNFNDEALRHVFETLHKKAAWAEQYANIDLGPLGYIVPNWSGIAKLLMHTDIKKLQNKGNGARGALEVILELYQLPGLSPTAVLRDRSEIIEEYGNGKNTFGQKDRPQPYKKLSGTGHAKTIIKNIACHDFGIAASVGTQLFDFDVSDIHELAQEAISEDAYILSIAEQRAFNKEYRELCAKTKRTPEEEWRFERLKKVRYFKALCEFAYNADNVFSEVEQSTLRLYAEWHYGIREKEAFDSILNEAVLPNILLVGSGKSIDDCYSYIEQHVHGVAFSVEPILESAEELIRLAKLPYVIIPSQLPQMMRSIREQKPETVIVAVSKCDNKAAYLAERKDRLAPQKEFEYKGSDGKVQCKSLADVVGHVDQPRHIVHALHSYLKK